MKLAASAVGIVIDVVSYFSAASAAAVALATFFSCSLRSFSNCARARFSASASLSCFVSGDLKTGGAPGDSMEEGIGFGYDVVTNVLGGCGPADFVV